MRGYSNQYDEVGIDIARRIIKGQSPYDEEEINSCLYEMAPLYGRSEKSPSISVYYIPRDKHCTNYFKLVRGSSYEKAKEVCRISLKAAKYEPIHGNDDGKVQFYPNRDEIKNLVQLLSSPCKKHNGMNVLEGMIKDANIHLEQSGFQTLDTNAVTPETYSKLPTHARG